MKTFNSLKPRKGFTLIELIVVIAIIAVLAGVGYPFYLSMVEKGRVKAAETKCVDIVTGVKNFYRDYSAFPVRDGELEPNANDEFHIVLEPGKDAGLLAALTVRENKNDEILNGDRKLYLDSSLQDVAKDGLYENNGELGLYDPWGTPYRVAFTYLDATEGGVIDPYAKGKQTRQQVIAYSLGTDTEGTPKKSSTLTKEEYDESLQDNIYTWKKQGN